MDIKKFQNPWKNEWQPGGKYDPNWLGGDEVLSKTAISVDPDSEEDDNYDQIDVIIETSSIEGVKQMSFEKTHISTKNNPSLRVRYLDENGNVKSTGDNFKAGSLEYELFNHEARFFEVPKNLNSIFLGRNSHLTPPKHVKFWLAWKRYWKLGEEKSELRQDAGGGNILSFYEALPVEPNSLFYFTAYFVNHSKTEITNKSEIEQIILEIKTIFEKDGKIKVKAKNANLSKRQVAFLAVGYHSPEPTDNSELNNTELAIGRAITLHKILYLELEPIGIKDIGKMSGGDSMEKGVRKAVTYFGVKKFIDTLNIEYTPPTIGE